MKKIIVSVLCILSMLTATSFAACNVKAADNSSQIPNPYINCRTMAKAEKIAGFKMTAKNTLKGYSHRKYQAIKKEMIQVSWSKDGKRLLIRKAKGTADISGDYNTYAKKITVKIGKKKVTMKGNGKTYNVASWKAGKHAFAVDSDKSISQKKMTKLVKAAH